MLNMRESGWAGLLKQYDECKNRPIFWNIYETGENRMKLNAAVIIALTLLFQSSASADDGNDVIYQASTIQSLLSGVYDGSTTFAQLKKHGGFGLGTINGIDGEMVALDGTFYRIDMKGKAHIVEDERKTPFAVVTRFEEDAVETVTDIESIKSLQKKLDLVLPSKNIFYAIKIVGKFDYLKVRSVPKQHKPYPPLEDIMKQQGVFEHNGVSGTLVGYRMPAYAKGVNVAGYHFHFISLDKKFGGHLLDIKTKSITAKLDLTRGWYISLPTGGEFDSKELPGYTDYDINKVER